MAPRRENVVLCVVIATITVGIVVMQQMPSTPMFEIYSEPVGGREENITSEHSFSLDEETRREHFLETYVGPVPSLSYQMNMSLSVAQSGALKFPHARNESLDFDSMVKFRQQMWSEDYYKNGSDSYNDPANKKYILFSNIFSSTTNFAFAEGSKEFVRMKCPISNCHSTLNRGLVPSHKFDAVVHSIRLYTQQNLFNSTSYPNATHGFIFAEAPTRLVKKTWKQFDNIFDYAMSNRHDSDSPFSYGSIVPKSKSEEDSYTDMNKNFAAGKTKMAAWFVSNCRTTGSQASHRERLTEVIRQYGVVVDVYGKCGNFTCPRKQSGTCDEMLRKDYKFYFAFENTLCNQYVTEKFYRAYQNDVVPVTFGLGHELTGAPKDSYINALDFKDIESLAKHLLYLNGNDTAYNEYFGWKEHYKYNLYFGPHHSICKLCADLHTGTGIRRKKKYDFDNFYDSQCIDVTKNKRLLNFLQL